MTDQRRRARVAWVAIGVAITILALGIVWLAYFASYFSRYHSGWREADPKAIQDLASLPLMAAAWWIKICLEDWLNGA